MLLDEVVLVSTDEICAAIRDVFEDTRAIVEPAGALAVAGLKRWLGEHPGEEVDGRWSRSTAAPTSTSRACATSPSAPISANGARRCSR
jgi:threonine dehydratase